MGKNLAKRIFWFFSFSVCCGLISWFNGTKGHAETIIDMGKTTELFVDDYLIDEMHTVVLKLHSPKEVDKALIFDSPWEGPFCTYVSIIQDKSFYRMYYRGGNTDLECREVTCYAESKDGINWYKPCIGIHESEGSSENNIIWIKEGSHNFTPFLDTRPDVPVGERYKALGGNPPLSFVSLDGINWNKLQEEPVMTKGAFDSQNVAFWDEFHQEYKAYYRIFIDDVRAIAQSSSKDFIHWSDPEPIRLGDISLEHFYTNATIPYFRAPHILLAFPMRFLPLRKVIEEHPIEGISDGVFLTSRDGLNFDYRFRESFLRPGRDWKNWTDRNNMFARGIIQTAADELSLYAIRNYRHTSAYLARFVLRTDGFVSVNAPFSGGEFTTRPLIFSGNYLVLNYETSAAGSIQVELMDEQKVPIKNYTLSNSIKIYGDKISHVVEWENGKDLGHLSGRTVRLRFVMKDADLYSIQFVLAETSQ